MRGPKKRKRKNDSLRIAAIQRTWAAKSAAGYKSHQPSQRMAEWGAHLMGIRSEFSFRCDAHTLAALPDAQREAILRGISLILGATKGKPWGTR